MHMYIVHIRYMVTLGAPISIAQRMGEDTLTYLNRGMYMSSSLPLSVVNDHVTWPNVGRYI